MNTRSSRASRCCGRSVPSPRSQTRQSSGCASATLPALWQWLMEAGRAPGVPQPTPHSVDHDRHRRWLDRLRGHSAGPQANDRFETFEEALRATRPARLCRLSLSAFCQSELPCGDSLGRHSRRPLRTVAASPPARNPVWNWPLERDGHEPLSGDGGRRDRYRLRQSDRSPAAFWRREHLAICLDVEVAAAVRDEHV